MWCSWPFSKALRLFPKQHCVTRAAKACFMSAIACSDRPVDCLLLSMGGSKDYNLCRDTWRFGLDWSFSAPNTQWVLLDSMLPPQTIYGRHWFKREMFELSYCVKVESPLKPALQRYLKQNVVWVFDNFLAKVWLFATYLAYWLTADK